MELKPNSLLVRARIPSNENEGVCIVDTAGRLPLVEVADPTANPEHILRLIGESVIGSSLSIDHMISRQNIHTVRGVINVSDVCTKPVSPNVSLSGEYRWGDV